MVGAPWSGALFTHLIKSLFQMNTYLSINHLFFKNKDFIGFHHDWAKVTYIIMDCYS